MRVASINGDDVRLERNMKRAANGSCAVFETLQLLCVIHLIKCGK